MLTETEHLISCLAEECAEVAQRCSKALRFGLNEVQPGQQLDNAERITIELNDLMTVLDMLVERGAIPNPIYSPDKRDKVLRLMVYARREGALQ